MSDAKKLPDFIFKSGIGPESMNEELFIGCFMEEECGADFEVRADRSA